jgi:hypothetical protein
VYRRDKASGQWLVAREKRGNRGTVYVAAFFLSTFSAALLAALLLRLLAAVPGKKPGKKRVRRDRASPKAAG